MHVGLDDNTIQGMVASENPKVKSPGLHKMSVAGSDVKDI